MNNELKTTLNIRETLRQNIVVVIFLILTTAGFFLSGLQFPFFVSELVSRMTRNSFLVLSLIIPILAGIGLNFGIVVGAMAGQAALLAVTYWEIPGIGGLALAFLLALPLAMLFGWLVAMLFNRTKGQEMVAGLIVSFFANGLYQFFFLYVLGNWIPMKDTPMLKPDGIGLRNTVSMGSKYGEGIKYSLDWLVRVNLWIFLAVICALVIVIMLIRVLRRKDSLRWPPLITLAVMGVASIGLSFVPGMLSMIKAPVVTWILIAGLCFYTSFIMKTKLGQDFRAVGRSQHISGVAGIHVDRTRTVATIMSTVLAAWGQIIFLQNVGTMNVYGSHMQVGMNAVAAILIGGASVSKAGIRNALVGALLFHSIFIVSPNAGKALFDGNAQIGEFFRASVVYGVIGVSLGLHAWKVAGAKRKAA